MKDLIMPNNKGAAMVAVLAMVLVLNIALIAFFFSVNHTRKKKRNPEIKVDGSEYR